MRKIFKELMMFGGIIAVSWWMGGMMYFIMVTKHHRDQEKYEELQKNITSYVGGPIRDRNLKPSDRKPSFPRSIPEPKHFIQQHPDVGRNPWRV